MRVTLERWSAWAPGCEDRDAWRTWARDPGPLPCEGHPEARFLPALLRRRCTPLTRIVLSAAFDCCAPEDLAHVRTVFASRHGSINESLGLLEAVARRERVSAAIFSHTVHNAQAGLFSIAAGNRLASSSLAAREDTFACGWLEALLHLERDPGRPVLLVMGDVPLAPTFATMVEEPVVPYAAAFLLAREGAGPALWLDLEEGEPRPSPRAWPDALELVRWLHTDEPTLRLDTASRRWRWRRAD